MRNSTRLGERLLALGLVFMLLFSMMPGAYATGEEQEITPVELPDTMYSIDVYSGTYDGNSHDAVAVTLQEGTTAKYSTDGISYVEEIPTVTEVGELTVYVQLSAEGYIDITKEVTAKVVKAERPAMTFSVANVGQKKIDDTLANPVNAMDAAYEPQTVSYESSDNSVATVDASGLVTFLKSGEVTITAKMPASDHYTESTASYVVNVGLKTMVLTFATGEAEIVYTDDNGATITNVLNNGSDLPGKVTYTSSEDSVAVVDEEGKVTFQKPGTVTITATMAETATYAEATASYTVSAKYGSSVLSFETAEPVAVTYEEGLTFKNVATGADHIVYSIESQKLDGEDYNVAEISEDGTVTVKSAGVVTVKAAVAETEDTYGSSVTYILTINRAAREIGFSQSVQTIDWSAGKKHVQTATGADNIVYEIISETLDGAAADVADINTATGEVTVKTAGAVTVKASAAQTDTHLAAQDVQYTLNINRVAQDALVFDTAEPEALAYNDSINNCVSGGAGEGAITYVITAGETYGQLDGAKLTAIKADGTVTVKATKAQDACYQAASAEYTVETIKATQPALNFTQTNYSAFYGEEGLTVVAEGGIDGGKLIYSVDEDEKGTLKSLDAGTGEVEFKDGVVEGTATIKAVKTLENYEDIEATATVTVREGTLGEGAYSISEPNDLGWYTKENPAVISAAEGYSLSLGGYRASQFSDTLNLGNEGVFTGDNAAQVFYVKNEHGHIVKQSAEFKIDNTAPVDLAIKVNNSTLQLLAKVVTLGFYKNDVQITLSAKDDISGITSFVYNTSGSFGEGDVPVSATADKDGNYTTQFTVGAQYKNAIIFRAINGAGLNTEATSNGVIIVDSIAPNVKLEYTAGDSNTSGYYQSVTDVRVRVEEDNFDPDRVAVYVSKNGETAQKQGLVWESVSDAETATYLGTISNEVFTEEAVYTITATYTEIFDDLEDPVVHSDTISFIIDLTNPTIAVDYDLAKGENAEYPAYFADTRTATVTIVEHNFDVDLVNFDFGSKPGNEPSVVWDENDTEGDIHIATITYSAEDDYTFAVNMVDKANRGNDAETYDAEDAATNAFTIDLTNPTIAVDYDLAKGENAEYPAYFAGTRTATVTIVEHNFDVDLVNFDFGSKHGNEPSVEWDESDAEHDTYKATITYSAEDDYTFGVSMVDMANRGNDAETYDRADAATNAFTIDLTNPTIAVDYDLAKGENAEYPEYFAGTRTATVTIVEHNFDVELVDFDLGSKHGNEPSVEWDESGAANDTYKATITYSAEDDYTFAVNMVDKANRGNDAETYDRGDAATNAFTIDLTNPTIAVDYDLAKGENEKYPEYFADTRTATVTIVEHNFHKDLVNFDLGSEHGNEPSVAWDESGAANDIYKATITYSAEDDYTFGVNMVDKANRGNDAETYDRGDAATNAFTIDLTNPTIAVDYDLAKGENEKYPEYFAGTRTATVTIVEHNFHKDLVDFDLGSKHGNKPSVEWDESGAANDTYKATITYSAEDDYTFGVSMVDKANRGNDAETYDAEDAATNAFTIDLTNPTIAVDYDLAKSTDEEYPEYFAGTRKATVTIVEHNFHKDLVTFDITNTLEKQPSIVWDESDAEHDTYKATITYDKDGAYTFGVSMVDKANRGNDAETYDAEDVATNAFTIDQTNPAIQVAWSGDAADGTYGDFYNGNRKAVITVIDWNFDPARVTSVLKNSDGSIPSLSDWTSDGDAHTASVEFTAEGDYTFGMSCVDKAGNVGEFENVTFTIDKTNPVVSVSYDNNDVRNGNYYNQTRTATISITEHNFVADRVTVSLTATDDGQNTTVPTVSSWSSYGDRHTATIHYPGDAKYTFDIAIRDKAGNDSSDFAQQEFYVDMTAPALEITGVENESANNGDVIPVIRYSDTNIDMNSVAISLDGAVRKSVELLGSYANIHNGQVFTFENFAVQKEIDDIYTLTATLVDLAGNESTQTIIFSVNRFGSTYALDEGTEAQKDTYVQSPVDVVITETNTDKLSNIRITLYKNGESIALVADEDYEVKVTGGNGKWYKYTYTIFKENFQDDGVYSVTVYSEDAAGNVAENTLDTKGVEISFGVDKTAPTAFVANVEDNKTYPVEILTAILSANDNLKLSSVMVYLDDELYASWTEEEIEAILAGEGNFNFDILDDVNYAHNLRIICEDAASNVTEIEISDFYVTTNWFVRYYTNEPLFYGSIAGVLLLGAAIIFLVVKKKQEAVNR